MSKTDQSNKDEIARLPVNQTLNPTTTGSSRNRRGEDYIVFVTTLIIMAILLFIVWCLYLKFCYPTRPTTFARAKRKQKHPKMSRFNSPDSTMDDTFDSTYEKSESIKPEVERKEKPRDKDRDKEVDKAKPIVTKAVGKDIFKKQEVGLFPVKMNDLIDTGTSNLNPSMSSSLPSCLITSPPDLTVAKKEMLAKAAYKLELNDKVDNIYKLSSNTNDGTISVVPKRP